MAASSFYPGEDDKLLQRRLLDLCAGARSAGAPRFSVFLNERGQSLAEAVLSREQGIEFLLWGGYEGAVRKMAGIFPDYLEPDPASFPISVIAARHGRGEKLSHRDVLGSLTALGLAREAVGDILPEDGLCRFLTLSTVAKAALDDLSRIGRIGISCRRDDGTPLIAAQEYEELRGTVSSARLDSLVRMVTNLSRERAAELIRAGLVTHNYAEAGQISAGFSPGDTVSVRGYGKYVVDAVDPPTRKGRLPVRCRKYK